MATKSTKRRPAPETAAPRQGQLVLVVEESTQPWHLDDETKEIGRKGLAKAREALRAARAPDLIDAA